MSPDCRKKRNTWLRERLLAIHQPSRGFRNRSKSLLWPDLCVLPLPSSSLLQTSWLLIVSQTPSETLQPDGPSSWTAPPSTHASRAPPFLQIFHQCSIFLGAFPASPLRDHPCSSEPSQLSLPLGLGHTDSSKIGCAL